MKKKLEIKTKSKDNLQLFSSFCESVNEFHLYSLFVVLVVDRASWQLRQNNYLLDRFYILFSFENLSSSRTPVARSSSGIQIHQFLTTRRDAEQTFLVTSANCFEQVWIRAEIIR